MYFDREEDDSLSCERDTNEPENESWEDFDARQTSGINRAPEASINDGVTCRKRLNPNRYIRNMEH